MAKQNQMNNNLNENHDIRNFVIWELIVVGTIGVIITLLRAISGEESELALAIIDGVIASLGAAILVAIIMLLKIARKYQHDIEKLIEKTADNVMVLMDLNDSVARLKGTELARDMRALSLAAEAVHSSDVYVFTARLGWKLKKLRQLTEQLANGNMVVTGREIYWFTAEMFAMSTKIFATAFISEKDKFWDSDSGRLYIENLAKPGGRNRTFTCVLY